MCGHAGVGHCHSHMGLIQDDSGGLAVLLSLFQKATQVSLSIKKIEVTTGLHGSIKVITESGGIGVSYPRRGVTPQEAKIIKSLEGKQAIRTQTLVVEAFGRLYGQGVLETPVSLQSAICKAALNSFVKQFPSQFYICNENVVGNEGIIIGTVLDIDNIAVSALATVNATKGGLGPNEDLEGNSPIGNKGKLMKKLDLDKIPSIVIEGKVYNPSMSKKLDNSTFTVRADDIDDNPVVAEAIKTAAKSQGISIIHDNSTMKRTPGKLTENKNAFADKLISSAQQLKENEYSHEKVLTLSEIAKLVSEDAGGITFMSDRLHSILGGVGLLPATSAVYNLVVTENYFKENIMPVITDTDLKLFEKIAVKSINELSKNLDKATDHLFNNQSKTLLDEYVKTINI
ncbi:hypothetical protein CDO51_03485 [Natranaerobius trueperi]|uniref:Uncharacterized protein n=1 Tax=Natranaerobius trueperi TaxID=759412 RepID=A0A226BZ66_9FIRM|nr:hypothetical protein CDO51_03485 [Natranaerobius trueperi]